MEVLAGQAEKRFDDEISSALYSSMGFDACSSSGNPQDISAEWGCEWC